jgi:hypothetical protein
MDDRRKDPRVPLRTEAEVRFASWALFQLVWTVNISQGGMQLELDGDEPKKGAPLTVRLKLPQGFPVEIEAQVRHAVDVTRNNAPQKRWQVGVQLTGLDACHRAAIEQLLRTHGGPKSVFQRKKDSQ